MKDYTGQRFGSWTVIAQTPTILINHKIVRQAVGECICDCGTRREVFISNLVGGRSRSCGCLPSVRSMKYEMVSSVEYGVWQGMKGRCRNMDCLRYGGRGIKVCDRWQESFGDFIRDMGLRPGPEYSIERIDNDGGYWCGHCEECLANGWPSNCYWATREKQANNTRRNRFIEFDNRRQTLSQWAREIGITRQLLHWRLKNNESLEQALSS